MNLPFFSIIIPTYNQAELLKNCLDSIFRQSFNNFEIIVVDNSSKDNTRNVVLSYNDIRIKYTTIQNDGIVAKSRNYGISISAGKWICLIDSDDTWTNDKLQKVYDFVIADQDLIFVSHPMFWHNTKTGERKIMKCKFREENMYKNLLLRGNQFQNSSLSIKKEYLKEKNISINESICFKSVEDYDFILNIAKSGGKMGYIEDPLGDYNIYGNNMSLASFHHENLGNLLKHHVYDMQQFEPNKDKLWKEVYTICLLKKSNTAYKNHNYLQFLKGWIKSFFLSPKGVFRYCEERAWLSYNRIK